jgi:eukaryotic-like serine/threonine-protein kinase
MPVIEGTRLGPYEILSPLGAGGMGEVYRARDTRLGRDVAVKVLPATFSSDRDRLRRFEQEACAAGALNHPNILSIHDIGTHDGAPYVVSELLEGETLRKRISGTTLPQRRAIDYALQLAHGLAAAHEKGIVHRDLKPENIFITKDGRVKILDFGLAKLTQANGNESQSDIPTRRVDTDPGVVIGTVGYMSPEQVRGQTVDHRSDIFAFGAIVYEMLSGQRAFRGDSPADTMSAILKEDPPDLSATNHNVSPALERLVDHCLEKNPEERFHSARDLAFALEALSGSTATFTETLTAPRRLFHRDLIPWLIAAVFVLATIGLAVLYFRGTSPIEKRLSRFYELPPANMTFGFQATQFISPDGQKLLFRAVTTEGKGQLWVRALDSPTAQPIVGTEDASQAFWSPDSRFIGFFAEGKLRALEVSAGTAQTLAEAPSPLGGTWNRDGIIIFRASPGGGLSRVSATGGPATPVTTLDESRNETGHSWPDFLPDGRHFLYMAGTAGAQPEGEVYVGSLDPSESRKLLLHSAAGAKYAPPGYLLFLSQGALMAQRFDVQKLQLSGEPSRIAEAVANNPASKQPFFSVSDNGLIVYKTELLADSRLTWCDRSGKQLGMVGTAGISTAFTLSPDEKRAALSRADRSGFGGGVDIWFIDVSGGGSSRFTFDPVNEVNAVWAPDGSRIVFSSNKLGPYDLYWKLSSGAGNEELLYKSPYVKFATDWSSDGRFIVYQEATPQNRGDLWALPLFGDQKPIPLVQSESNESQGSLSPDGHWIAYTSNEKGGSQVYIQSFPQATGKWMISTNSGSLPRWRQDGKELFYLESDTKLMAVDVKTNGNNFEASSPKWLFDVHVPATLTGGPAYAVTQNGQRFLINEIVKGSLPPRLMVIENWTALLKKS